MGAYDVRDLEFTKWGILSGTIRRVATHEGGIVMAHSCPACDQACYCDLEDTFLEGGEDDCVHDCSEDEDDGYSEDD